jgi:predicted ATPase/class 3 adenylate cyclase
MASRQDIGDEVVRASAERRQLTIVFIDLADSTLLSERLDPEEFISVLHFYREICHERIERYGGQVARSFGDGMLAYFGLPHAHEDDAERAIHTALSILSTIRQSACALPSGAVRLGVRIGVSTGVVVVGNRMTRPEYDQQEIFGTPAHIAARLQAIAPINTVVIGHPTYELVRGAFRCADLGAQLLKGVNDPVQMWRVDDVLFSESRFEKTRPDPLTPMIGRAVECRRLMELWEQSLRGRGQVAIISGEPGIGKSRLVKTFRAEIAAARKQTLYLQCSPLHVNTPFAPAIELIKRVANLRETDSAVEWIDKLRRTIGYLAADLASCVGYYGAMLSIPATGDYVPADLSSQGARDRALDFMTEVTIALSRRVPVLVVFEDVQWIDPTSLELHERLVQRIASEQIMVIVTRRDDTKTPALSGPNIHAMPLARLEAAECEQMARTLAGDVPLPRTLLQRIAERTDGVPLFIEEVTRSARRVWEQYAGTTTERLAPSVPATIKDSLTERLDGLGGARQTAQIAAIFGRTFEFDALAAVSRLTRDRLDAALRKLVDDGLLRRYGEPPAAIYSFKHALLQEAAYESLLRDERRELHARAALWLAAGARDSPQLSMLGYHFSRAGMTQEAVDALLAAGKSALNRSANKEAIATLREALDLVAKLPASEPRFQQEIELLSLLAMAYTALSGWSAPAVERCYGRALELCRAHGSLRQRSIVLWGVTVTKLVKCEFAKSLAYAHEFLDLAASAQDDEVALMAHAAALIANFFLGNLEAARRSVEFVCARYDGEAHGRLVQVYQHDPKIVALCYGGHIDWLLGFPQKAKARCEEARRLARQLGDPFMLALALILGSSDHLYERDLAANWACVQEGIAVARQHGLQMYEIFGPLWAAEAAVSRRPGKAQLDELAALVETLLQNHAYLQAPLYQIFLAEEYVRLGDIATARSLAEAAERLMAQTGERWFEPEIHRVRARLLHRDPNPDHDQAMRLYSRALESARELCALGWELRASIGLAEFLHEQGGTDDARKVLEGALRGLPAEETSADRRTATALLQRLQG